MKSQARARGASLLLVVPLILTVLILSNTAMATPVTGAIFTTNASGTIVNGNIYDNKTDVFLNGGPDPKKGLCTAAGLDNGDYYFQVTDPSGSVLLSTDAISERRFTVLNGVITTYLGSTHTTGTGKCGSLSVGLFPFDDTPNPGGEYKVWVTPVADYAEGSGTFGFLNNASKTDNFKVQPTNEPAKVAITGYKFYDLNTDGQWTAGEVTIAGWKITKTPPADADVTFTDTVSATIGQYSFLVDANSGSYVIAEVLPGTSWIATTPTSGTVFVGSSNVTGPNFGNVCIGAGGGLTLGYWSNKNGQAAMTKLPWITVLSGLNLRKADGTDFDPAGYTAFRTWILSATATNMAYMLSAQLAAMELNVLNGSVNGNALVYAPGTSSANAAGFATVSAIMAEANDSLGANGVVLDGNSERVHQEALKNALDNANNNRTFVQSSPCPFTY